MRLAIDSGGYIKAADAARDANHGLAQDYVAFTGALSGMSAVAGSDDCGAAFAAEFDPAARAAVKAYADLVAATGGIAQLVDASLANHPRANRASTFDGGSEGTAYDGGDLPGGRGTVTVGAYSPPSVLGGDGAGPGWWHWVADKLGGMLYPDADTGGLRDAAHRWRSEADAIASYSAYLTIAATAVGDQTSPEAAVARDTCTRVGDFCDGLAEEFRTLADVLSGFADDVEHHRQEMEDALESFIEWTIGLLIASHGLALFTLGGSELIGQSAQAAKIAAAVAKVRGILAALATATTLRLAPVGRVAVTAGNISAHVRPLLTASARMAKVRAVGVAGERAAGIAKNSRRIPSISRPGRYRIPDQLDDAGKVIGEVKNVKYQGLTSQLRDFLAYAEQRPGWTFVLHVRVDTKISGPLQDLVNAGRIILRRTL